MVQNRERQPHNQLRLFVAAAHITPHSITPRPLVKPFVWFGLVWVGLGWDSGWDCARGRSRGMFPP